MRSSGAVYYGWYVLAASALTEVLAIGSTSYSAGLFVLPLQAEFHISRVGASSSLLILYVGAAAFSPIVGRVLDRYSIRYVVMVGAISLASALSAIALTHDLLLMALMLVLPAALGFSILGPLKTQTLAARWFERQRGLALGLSAAAAGAGGIIVVPMLSQAIERFGWRAGLLYESLTIGVIVVMLAAFILRDHPQDLDSGSPENPPKQSGTATSGIGSSLIWKDIYLSSSFWVPSLTLAFITGASQAAVITLVPYGTQLGFRMISAATLVSAFAVAAGATKVTAGLLADRVDPRLLLASAPLAMTLCWALLTFSAAYNAIFLASCCAGIALGCALPTTAGLIATSFGPARFGRVMGWTYTLNLSCGVGSVLLFGALYDKTKSYHLAFELFASLSASLVIATAIFLRVIPRGSPILRRSDLASRDAR